jgi:hypothetical protein
LEGIAVASRDRFYPAGSDPYRDLENLVNFEWDLPGINRCDERVSSLIKGTSGAPLIVLAVEADHFGGLHIKLSGNYSLELFPDDSLEGEYWRFFKLKSANHFVVTGKGIDE